MHKMWLSCQISIFHFKKFCEKKKKKHCLASAVVSAKAQALSLRNFQACSGEELAGKTRKGLVWHSRVLISTLLMTAWMLHHSGALFLHLENRVHANRAVFILFAAALGRGESCLLKIPIAHLFFSSTEKALSQLSTSLSWALETYNGKKVPGPHSWKREQC